MPRSTSVYDRQSGPRGGRDGLRLRHGDGHRRGASSAAGTLQLRAMLSPDPLMGRRGYPLLLAAGETRGRSDAAGRPPASARSLHGAVGELQPFGSAPARACSSMPACPASPPSARPPSCTACRSMDSPEAPITHHWLDSTHIAFGVVTAGLVLGDVKLEGSRFNGREPDQRRWNIETAPLDSTASRLSAGTRPGTLSLQASWARLIAPEQLDPARKFNPLVGERALHAPPRRRQLVVGDPGLGQSRRRRGGRARGRGRARPVDGLRPRRICPE